MAKYLQTRVGEDFGLKSFAKCFHLYGSLPLILFLLRVFLVSASASASVNRRWRSCASRLSRFTFHSGLLLLLPLCFGCDAIPLHLLSFQFGALCFLTLDPLLFLFCGGNAFDLLLLLRLFSFCFNPCGFDSSLFRRCFALPFSTSACSRSPCSCYEARPLPFAAAFALLPCDGLPPAIAWFPRTFLTLYQDFLRIRLRN